jgi:hypothetical protein
MAMYSNFEGTYKTSFKFGPKSNQSEISTSAGVISFKGSPSAPSKVLSGAAKTNVSFNGSETVKNIDVTSLVTDARECVLELLDPNKERIYTKVEATSATNVRVTTSPALPVGTYRLILVE